MKPVFTNNIYAVIKLNGRFAVVLKSCYERVQYTGTKAFAIEWATDNDIETA